MDFSNSILEHNFWEFFVVIELVPRLFLFRLGGL